MPECQACKRYVQHYIKENGKYREVYCGSCICGCRVRVVMYGEKACKMYEKKEKSSI